MACVHANVLHQPVLADGQWLECRSRDLVRGTSFGNDRAGNGYAGSDPAHAPNLRTHGSGARRPPSAAFRCATALSFAARIVLHRAEHVAAWLLEEHQRADAGDDRAREHDLAAVGEYGLLGGVDRLDGDRALEA